MPTGCVAGAVPSPTCGSDLRECLRLSANTEHVMATGCSTDSEGSGPFTYSFGSDGTVSIHEGPFQWQTTACVGTNPSSEPARESTGTWSALE
ncbi:hypothetical protein [Mycobacterium persicum]|uniref:hypothetical protein n=1 Tax=Mycobacterium persicum TaxID=1487726 RepID=UPI0015935171|nr:hypothetical protein [Mycobacterium persicum]